VSQSSYVQKYALMCLRLAADCRNIAADVAAPYLRAHFVRMAGVWTELADHAVTRH
jgi:hypothetical protein